MGVLLYPPYLQWEVVSDCNHKCIHCYNCWRTDDIPVEQKVDYDAITDEIIERKPVYVAITGGEPFLVFSKIEHCISRMVNVGISVSISTNGTLVTEEHIPFLKRNNIDLVISLPSIDSAICSAVCNGGGNVVKKLLALFVLLKKNQVPTTINIVVSRLNMETLYDTLKAVREYGFTVRVGIAQRPINASKKYLQYELDRNDFKKIVRQCIAARHDFGVDVDFSVCLPDCAFDNQEEYFEMKRGSCFAGTTHYAIGTNGDVKACQCDSKTYGNILTESFEVIYERMSIWRDGSLIPTECMSCNRLYSCRGGCRVEAYANTGNYRSLPTFADLSNVPVKFGCQESIAPFAKDSEFTLSSDVHFLEDLDCYRVSLGIVAVHLSREFAEWLQEHPKFVFNDLCQDSDISENELFATLRMLLSNKMLEVSC